MFKVRVDMEDIGEFEKFTEAFELFYEQVLDKVSEKTSLKWLETANFILYYTGSRRIGAMNFYQAFNFAHRTELLTRDGRLNKQAHEPAIEVVEKALK